MAVKCKLIDLMKKKGYRVEDVFRMTGLARTTITPLCQNKATRIDYGTINKLCTLFDCGIDDLLEFIRD